MSQDQSAKDRAQEAASAAAGEGQHVAGVAAGEARNVASEAAGQVRGLADQAVGQVQQQLDEQTRGQRDRIVGALGPLGDDLHRMADQADSGLASDLTREIATRVQSVTQHLDGRDPSELLDDVRRFARQRPGTFLLGALAAGVVVGRLARGTRDAIVAADAEPSGTTGLSGSPYAGGPATVPPVVPAGTSGFTSTPEHGTAAGDPVPTVPGTPPTPVISDVPPTTGSPAGGPTPGGPSV